jgi:hypothetical protein
VKTLARAATNALGALCLGLVIVAIGIAGLGIAGTHVSTRIGNDTSNDELTTSTATGELAREMDTAYATGEEALLAVGQEQRSRLFGSLYNSILPTTDAQLAYLERLQQAIPGPSTPTSSNSSSSGPPSAICSARSASHPIRTRRSRPGSRRPTSPSVPSSTASSGSSSKAGTATR